MVGSTFTITVGMNAFEAAGRKIGKAFQLFRQLHPLLQIRRGQSMELNRIGFSCVGKSPSLLVN
jgi:hypothetical protein